MSKLTFRADDDLVERVEALDASKSEIMREALREYLDARTSGDVAPTRDRGAETIDAVIAERVDALVREYLASRERDVNVNISLDGATADARRAAPDPEPVSDADDESDAGASDRAEPADRCGQCGEAVSPDHVYCPNCGEKRSRRVFCECGDEVRTDWSFCPSCGRRTPAADVLEQP